MAEKRKSTYISKEYVKTKLADKVPLRTPYSIHFTPTTFCNLKCIFCMHSSTHECYKAIMNKKVELDFVEKVIDDIKGFPDKLKALHFCGMGETLLHKDIAKMLKYAKDANIAEKVDITTNGVLLTNEMADDLADSGVDFVRISLNGLSDDDYIKYCGVKVDFNKYVENLRYFYENRKKTKIYLKIFDFMLDGEGVNNKDFFYKTFEPICDIISIEYYNECYIGTKGGDSLKDSEKNQSGEDSIKCKICSHPFFKLIITEKKEVFPCCEPRFPFSLGNAEKESVVNIWDNKILNCFRLEILNGRENSNEICRNCLNIKINHYSDDNIDSQEKRLKRFYKKQLSK